MQQLNEYLENISPGIKEALNSGAIISGSTVLYFYMLEHNLQPFFLPDDIDIFCKPNTAGYDAIKKMFKTSVGCNKQVNTNNRSNSNFITSICSEKHNTTINGISRNFPLNLSPIISCVRSYIFDINNNYIFDNKNNDTANKNNDTDTDVYNTNIGINKKNKIKLDSILLSNKFVDKIPDFIDKYFDFDFCKVYFDGKKIYALYPETIFTRTIKLNNIPMSKYLSCGPEKKIIYQDLIRNYHLIPSDYIFNDFNDPTRTLRRLRKYTVRGFYIETYNFKIDCNYGDDIMTQLNKIVNTDIGYTIHWREIGPVICIESGKSYINNDVIHKCLKYMNYNDTQ